MLLQVVGVTLRSQHVLSAETPGAGLKVASLTIDGKYGSTIALGDDFKITAARGTLGITKGGQTALEVADSGTVSVQNLHTQNSLRVDGQLSYQGLSQWFLVRAEDFNTGCTAWSNCTRTACGEGHLQMLGGFGAFAGGEVQKLFVRLDSPHTEIRLKATFHFIDRWSGETAYAKLDNQIVWTESYELAESRPLGINLCGSPDPENKFAVAIDVVIPHSTSACTVAFGSLLDGPATRASWGVSDVQLLLR
jgi:hypothetical protein